MELHSCFAALPSFPNNFRHLRILIEILLVITQWPSLQLVVPDLQVEYIIVERRFAFSGVGGRCQVERPFSARLRHVEFIELTERI